MATDATLWTAILESTIRTSTPLLLAAIGETLVERAGIINVGLEGAIIAGAYAGLVVASASGATGGILGAIAAGALVGAVASFFILWIRANQIITGTALSLLLLGVTAALYQVHYGAAGAGLGSPTLGAIALPGLSRLPLVGQTLFVQPVTTYAAILLVPLTWWFLYRTHAGLALRACGENRAAARATGVRVRTLRAAALVVGGALGGLAGGSLVLAQVGTFAEGMSAGRGFIAIAIVALGRWHPGGVALAALLFGAASALQYALQAIGRTLPYQVFLALPYVLTLAGLALGARRRAEAPAELGRDG